MQGCGKPTLPSPFSDAQSGAAGTSEERRLIRYVRKGLFPYLFSAYKLTAKAYGMLIAVFPPLARKLFAPR